MVLRPNGTASRTSSGSSSVAYVEPLSAAAWAAKTRRCCGGPQRDAAMTASAVARRKRFTARARAGESSW